MAKIYVMFMTNEDGNFFTFFDEDELQDLLDNPEEHGINKFLDEMPKEGNMYYWPEGHAVLFEIKGPLKTTIKATAFRLEEE